MEDELSDRKLQDLLQCFLEIQELATKPMESTSSNVNGSTNMITGYRTDSCTSTQHSVASIHLEEPVRPTMAYAELSEPSKSRTRFFRTMERIPDHQRCYVSMREIDWDDKFEKTPDALEFVSVRNSIAYQGSFYGQWSPSLMRKIQDQFGFNLGNMRWLHAILRSSTLPLDVPLLKRDFTNELSSQLEPALIKALIGHILCDVKSSMEPTSFQSFSYDQKSLQNIFSSVYPSQNCDFLLTDHSSAICYNYCSDRLSPVSCIHPCPVLGSIDVQHSRNFLLSASRDQSYSPSRFKGQRRKRKLSNSSSESSTSARSSKSPSLEDSQVDKGKLLLLKRVDEVRRRSKVLQAPADANASAISRLCSASLDQNSENIETSCLEISRTDFNSSVPSTSSWHGYAGFNTAAGKTNYQSETAVPSLKYESVASPVPPGNAVKEDPGPSSSVVEPKIVGPSCTPPSSSIVKPTLAYGLPKKLTPSLPVVTGSSAPKSQNKLTCDENLQPSVLLSDDSKDGIEIKPEIMELFQETMKIFKPTTMKAKIDYVGLFMECFRRISDTLPQADLQYVAMLLSKRLTAEDFTLKEPEFASVSKLWNCSIVMNGSCFSGYGRLAGSSILNAFGAAFPDRVADLRDFARDRGFIGWKLARKQYSTIYCDEKYNTVRSKLWIALNQLFFVKSPSTGTVYCRKDAGQIVYKKLKQAVGVAFGNTCLFMSPGPVCFDILSKFKGGYDEAVTGTHFSVGSASLTLISSMFNVSLQMKFLDDLMLLLGGGSLRSNANNEVAIDFYFDLLSARADFLSARCETGGNLDPAIKNLICGYVGEKDTKVLNCLVADDAFYYNLLGWIVEEKLSENSYHGKQFFKMWSFSGVRCDKSTYQSFCQQTAVTRPNSMVVTFMALILKKFTDPNLFFSKVCQSSYACCMVEFLLFNHIYDGDLYPGFQDYANKILDQIAIGPYTPLCIQALLGNVARPLVYEKLNSITGLILSLLECEQRVDFIRSNCQNHKATKFAEIIHQCVIPSQFEAVFHAASRDILYVPAIEELLAGSDETNMNNFTKRMSWHMDFWKYLARDAVEMPDLRTCSSASDLAKSKLNWMQTLGCSLSSVITKLVLSKSEPKVAALPPQKSSNLTDEILASPTKRYEENVDSALTMTSMSTPAAPIKPDDNYRGFRFVEKPTVPLAKGCTLFVGDTSLCFKPGGELNTDSTARNKETYKFMDDVEISIEWIESLDETMERFTPKTNEEKFDYVGFFIQCFHRISDIRRADLQYVAMLQNTVLTSKGITFNNLVCCSKSNIWHSSVLVNENRFSGYGRLANSSILNALGSAFPKKVTDLRDFGSDLGVFGWKLARRRYVSLYKDEQYEAIRVILRKELNQQFFLKPVKAICWKWEKGSDHVIFEKLKQVIKVVFGNPTVFITSGPVCVDVRISFRNNGCEELLTGTHYSPSSACLTLIFSMFDVSEHMKFLDDLVSLLGENKFIMSCIGVTADFLYDLLLARIDFLTPLCENCENLDPSVDERFNSFLWEQCVKLSSYSSLLLRDRKLYNVLKFMAIQKVKGPTHMLVVSTPDWMQLLRLAIQDEELGLVLVEEAIACKDEASSTFCLFAKGWECLQTLPEFTARTKNSGATVLSSSLSGTSEDSAAGALLTKSTLVLDSKTSPSNCSEEKSASAILIDEKTFDLHDQKMASQAKKAKVDVGAIAATTLESTPAVLLASKCEIHVTNPAICDEKQKVQIGDPEPTKSSSDLSLASMAYVGNAVSLCSQNVEMSSSLVNAQNSISAENSVIKEVEVEAMPIDKRSCNPANQPNTLVSVPSSGIMLTVKTQIFNVKDDFELKTERLESLEEIMKRFGPKTDEAKFDCVGFFIECYHMMMNVGIDLQYVAMVLSRILTTKRITLTEPVCCSRSKIWHCLISINGSSFNGYGRLANSCILNALGLAFPEKITDLRDFAMDQGFLGWKLARKQYSSAYSDEKYNTVTEKLWKELNRAFFATESAGIGSLSDQVVCKRSKTVIGIVFGNTTSFLATTGPVCVDAQVKLKIDVNEELFTGAHFSTGSAFLNVILSMFDVTKQMKFLDDLFLLHGAGSLTSNAYYEVVADLVLSHIDFLEQQYETSEDMSPSVEKLICGFHWEKLARSFSDSSLLRANQKLWSLLKGMAKEEVKGPAHKLIVSTPGWIKLLQLAIRDEELSPVLAEVVICNDDASHIFLWFSKKWKHLQNLATATRKTEPSKPAVPSSVVSVNSENSTGNEVLVKPISTSESKSPVSIEKCTNKLKVTSETFFNFSGIEIKIIWNDSMVDTLDKFEPKVTSAEFDLAGFFTECCDRMADDHRMNLRYVIFVVNECLKKHNFHISEPTFCTKLNKWHCDILANGKSFSGHGHLLKTAVFNALGLVCPKKIADLRYFARDRGFIGWKSAQELYVPFSSSELKDMFWMELNNAFYLHQPTTAYCLDGDKMIHGNLIKVVNSILGNSSVMVTSGPVCVDVIVIDNVHASEKRLAEGTHFSTGSACLTLISSLFSVMDLMKFLDDLMLVLGGGSLKRSSSNRVAIEFYWDLLLARVDFLKEFSKTDNNVIGYNFREKIFGNEDRTLKCLVADDAFYYNLIGWLFEGKMVTESYHEQQFLKMWSVSSSRRDRFDHLSRIFTQQQTLGLSCTPSINGKSVTSFSKAFADFRLFISKMSQCNYMYQPLKFLLSEQMVDQINMEYLGTAKDCVSVSPYATVNRGVILGNTRRTLLYTKADAVSGLILDQAKCIHHVNLITSMCDGDGGSELVKIIKSQKSADPGHFEAVIHAASRNILYPFAIERWLTQGSRAVDVRNFADQKPWHIVFWQTLEAEDSNIMPDLKWPKEFIRSILNQWIMPKSR